MFNSLQPITQYDKAKVSSINEHLIIVSYENDHYINYSFLSDYGLCSDFLLTDLLTVKSSLRLFYYKRKTFTLINFKEVQEAAIDELYQYYFMVEDICPLILEKKTYLVNELAKIGCIIRENLPQ